MRVLGWSADRYACDQNGYHYNIIPAGEKARLTISGTREGRLKEIYSEVYETEQDAKTYANNWCSAYGEIDEWAIRKPIEAENQWGPIPEEWWKAREERHQTRIQAEKERLEKWNKPAQPVLEKKEEPCESTKSTEAGFCPMIRRLIRRLFAGRAKR
jgi:hypothetical protein